MKHAVAVKGSEGVPGERRHKEELVAAGVKTVKSAGKSKETRKSQEERGQNRIGGWVVSPHVSWGRSIGCSCGRTRRVARP